VRLISPLSGIFLQQNSLEEVATKKGATMAQIALAWSMAQDLVTAPIVGTTSLKNLQDLLGMHIEINQRMY
jgi:aryl-alcohol dehydrogenase-like predicted oxidoreductase